MKRPLLYAVPVVAAVVIAYLVWPRGGHDKPEAPPTPPAATPAAPAPRPAEPATNSRDRTPPRDLAVLQDDDRPGTLRLEGLVLGTDEQPVAKATVTVSTTPPRSAVTEDDGTFSFEQLVGRPYTLVARADEGVAGPITARLTAKSDPVVLRLQPGASVEVTVISAADQRPVAGATVELRGLERVTAATDGAGVALFRGVPRGGHELVASARGHAPSHARIGVGSGAIVEKEQLVLKRGAAVSGRVVNAGGQAVAGARVTYSGAADWSQQADARLDAVETDAAGAFTIPALPAGTFRFVGRHERFAAGRSELVTLDGEHERRGVEIRLAPAATLAGQVVSTSGEPIGWATVRVGEKVEGVQFDEARQTFADENGRFEMSGLARKAVQALAQSEDAVSEVVEVDLTGKAERRDVVLTLSVDGAIAGIVVDGKGEPREGAQVWAWPDFRADGGVRRGMGGSSFRLRGLPRELTDAGGRFRLTGLAPGAYELRASPTGGGGMDRGWLREATSAKVGDIDVKLVLPADGGIKGKVTFADGSAPDAFTVGVGGFGGGSPFASADGAFELGELPPREYTVSVQGPGFDEKKVPGVVVEADGVTDLGTIKVTKGRSVAGRVVTPGGEPVPGATVLAGRRMFGDGAKSQASAGGPPGARGKEAISDENGNFVMNGVGPRELNVLAEHDTVGRSNPLRIPGGAASVTGLQLVLAPFGAIEGTVTKGGQPAEGVLVGASSQTFPEITYGVASGADGTFRFDHLAPDTYNVSALDGSNPMQGMGFHPKVVVVASGQIAKTALDLGAGQVTLMVKPVAKAGSTVRLSFLRVVAAPIAAKTARALELEVATLGAVYSHLGLAFGSNAKPVPGIEAGTYSVCVVPFPAEVMGMGPTMEYVEREGDNLPVFCKSIKVGSAPGEVPVNVLVEVPAFVPAPPQEG